MMEINKVVNYLEEPVPITEQSWDKDIKPVVSIGCITYNQEKYIGEAIEGFLMQKTTFPVEIIIHDDASTDSTRKIIREYKEKYTNLIRILLQNENQWSKTPGSIYARFVYPKVKGKYIALCEGDDYWTDPLKLEKQIEFLEKNSEYSMSSHEVNFEYDEINPKGRYYGNPKIKSNFEQILFSDFFIPLNSIVFRSEYVNFFPDWFSENSGGHKALVYLLSSKGKNYHYMEKMGVKRRNPGGVTIKYKKERKKTKLKRQVLLLKNLKKVVDSEKKGFINKKIKKIYLKSAKKEAKNKNFFDALFYFLKYII